MKNEEKLQRLIRKIVKEELANLHQEPAPPHHPEFSDWGMLDEPFEFPPRERENHQPDLAHDLPDWCESVQTEGLSSRTRNISPQKRRKRKKRR